MSASENAPEQSPLDRLLHMCMFAADRAAIEASRDPQTTPHMMTTAAVRAALELAVGNRLITITPLDDWPTYVSLDPPFTRSDLFPWPGRIDE